MAIDHTAHAALYREQARRIAVALGDRVGNREAVILADPDVRVRRDGAYPGCWVVSTPNISFGAFVYRVRDSAIVG